MVKFFLTKNPRQTKKLGKALAKEVIRGNLQNLAIVLGLVGDLGGGKTTFLQGFAEGLGIKQKILSPTFIIMKKFKIGKYSGKFTNFYHIDCYRIQRPKEILNLGFKKIISSPQNIVALEWAEKLKKFLPKDTIWINFKFVDKKTRKIKIKKEPNPFK